MKSLLIIAHGSRRTESNLEILNLRDKIANKLSSINLIEHAFLELASPNISEATAKLVSSGASEIIVVPYFLVAGQHVAADIPEEIETLERRYPDTAFTVAPYFGSSDGVVMELLSQVQPLVD